jgi:hypothetical protein
LYIITGSKGGRRPALHPSSPQRLVQIVAEHLEIHCHLEALEMIPKIAQPLQPIIDIKKSRLLAHRLISALLSRRESEKSTIGEVLRSVHLHLAAFGFLSLLMAMRYYRSTNRVLDGTVVGVALLFFIASMMPVATSLFDGRQHLYAAPQSILLIMFFWALYGLTASPIVTGAIVAATVISAALGFGQKLVYPHAFALDYARAAIADRLPSEKPNIIVIKPSAPAQRCMYEPCSGFYARNLNALLKGRFIFTKGSAEQNASIGEVTEVPRQDAARVIEGSGICQDISSWTWMKRWPNIASGTASSCGHGSSAGRA